MKARPSLPFTDSDTANRLLEANPLALLLGMMLDQQYPMEAAFRGPLTLEQRLGGLDAAEIAAMDPSAVEAAFLERPAVHRYPAAMAKRAQALCRHIASEYGGDPAGIWATARSGAELYERVRALPGFGEQKARIFVGVLGKRLGVRPAGWEEKAADWPSVADVDSFANVAELRERKRAMKAAQRKP